MSLLSPRRLVATGAAALSLALVAGCGATSDSESESAETRTVKTEQGDVEVPVDADKIVVLNYALAGYLYNLDVPVTATIPEHTDGEAAASELWDNEGQETEFLPWSTDGFDLEAILETDPDLIIAGGIGFPLKHATDSYDQLSDIAPTVVVSGKLGTWQKQFSFLAKDVFDKEDVYDKAVADYEARVEEVKENITLPPGPVSYVSITADKTPYILIEDMGLPKTMSALGFEAAPLFEENDVEPYTAGGDSFEASTEKVGQILTTPTVFVLGFNMKTHTAAELAKEPVYSQLPAFEEGNAYDLPYWALRGDYDEAMELLNILEEEFGK